MHIVPVSGGWDSAITYLFLTGYLRDGHSTHWVKDGVVGVFTDPGHEHPNNYRVLDALEEMTGREIVRLRGPTWEEALEAHSWFLPFHRARWCTSDFKIKPFQGWVREMDAVSSYIGLRADEEHRTGYLADKGSNITPLYPLREMGITFADRERLGKQVGLPESGLWSCFNCMFKQMHLWVKLVENFPEQAEWCAWAEEEKERRGAGGYTWIRGYTVRELIDNPVTRSNIMKRYWKKHDHEDQMSFIEPDPEEMACLMCQVK